MAGILYEDQPFLPGEIIAGKYRIDSILGKGGMGLVVKATHLQLFQSVALKFLLPNGARTHQAVERFLREARAAVRLTSEHVGRVLDVGTTERGAPYIVMEYLDGRDLGAVLKQNGPLPIADAVDYVRQACEAVGEAHALGIVHRDLKPTNLFLVYRPNGKRVVKVLDFGISKVTDPSISGDASELTTDAIVMGSPAYMAPEQAMSTKNVDARADIWGLGVCLFRLLTGQLPFRGATALELGAQLLHAPPQDPRTLRWDLPLDLCAVVLRCLEKDPAHRYQTAEDLAEALAQCNIQPNAAAPAPVSVARLPVLPMIDDVSAKMDTAWGNTSAARKKSPRRTRIVVGLVAACALLAMGVAWVASRSPTVPNVGAVAATSNEMMPSSSSAPSPPPSSIALSSTMRSPPVVVATSPSASAKVPAPKGRPASPTAAPLEQLPDER